MLIMALFSSLFRELFECFSPYMHRREKPQKTQQNVAQEFERLSEEREDFTANDRKCRKRRRKVPEKCQLGEREEKREVKNEGKISKGGSREDEPEEERETLRLEKIKKNGRVHQKKRKMQSLEKLVEGGSECREAGERKKERRRKITEPMPLLVEVKPLHSRVGSSFLKPIEGELPMLPSVSEHLALPAARFKPLPPVTKPSVHPQEPDPAPEDELSLPCSPFHVDPPKLLAVPPRPTPAHDELLSMRSSSSQVDPPKRLPPSPTPAPEDEFSLPCSPLYVDSPKFLVAPPRPTPAPDELLSIRSSSSQVCPPRRLPPSPTPAPDEVVALRRPPSRKPQPFTSSPLDLPPQLMLINIEDEETEYVEYTGKTFRASDFLKPERPQTPEAEIKTKKVMAWLEKDSEVDPPRRLPPSPTPAPDEVVALRRPPSRKPQPFTSSPLDPPPQLMLINIEDEETEYVEYTGKTFWASDFLKPERPQTPEAEIKPRKMMAWLEKDSEVQEEVWASELEDIQGFEEEEDDPSEMGAFKAIRGHIPPASPKNETQENVQEKCKRKVPLVLFTWVEEKAKKNEVKKIQKEKERREKELLLERYRNDPKLKHLWINKHNRNYNSFE